MTGRPSRSRATSELAEPSDFALPTHHERFLAAIVESAEDGIFAKALDGRILSWNAGAEQIYGYSAREIVGDSVYRLAAPDRHAEIASIMERIRAGHRIDHFETIRVRKSGEPFPVSLGISPVRDAGGTIIGASTIARDITEQHRLTDAVSLMNARLRAVIASIDDGAFVCGADGRIMLRNRVAGELAPGVETEADLLALLRASTDAVLTDAVLTDAPADPHEFELSVKGETRWVRLSRHPIRMHDPAERRPAAQAGRIVLLRDVTEVRSIQASQEAFSGVLSHELRTPITTILGAAKVLGRVRGHAARELLDDIGAEAERLYRLVEDLLVLTRFERGSLSMADEPVLVGRVIERVLALERGNLRGQRFVLRIEKDLPIVRGDGTYVEQLIRNLVGNAMKYGGPDGTITVAAERSAGGVRVRVIDEGPGIRAGEQDRVFDLLYRSPATEAQAAGSGVGLFVSRRLAEAMGGRIWAEVRDGPGAEFLIELPLYADQLESQLQAGEDASHRPSRRQSKRARAEGATVRS